MSLLLLGDETGLDELREGLRLSIEIGKSNQAGHTSTNLAQYEAVWRGPRSATARLEEGLAFVTSRGLRTHVAYHRLCEIAFACDMGDHDRVLAETPALEATFASFGWVYAQVDIKTWRLRIATLRGSEVDSETLTWIAEAVRASAEPDDQMGLAASVPALLLRGERAKAHELLVELLPQLGLRNGWNWQPRHVTPLVRAALALDDLDLAESIRREFLPVSPYAHHAAVASTAAILEARGDLEAAIAAYADAADRWATFGVVPEEAFALMGEGRCLAATGRADEAGEPLARARTIFERLKAAPALAEIAAISSG
jgi:tetratricopeptide (TPR) repeat protein